MAPTTPIKASHTIKFNGQWYPPGAELEVDETTAAELVADGAAVLIEAPPEVETPPEVEDEAPAPAEEPQPAAEAEPEPAAETEPPAETEPAAETEPPAETEPAAETEPPAETEPENEPEMVGGVLLDEVVTAIEACRAAGEVVTKSGKDKGKPTVEHLEKRLGVRDLNSAGRDEAWEAFLARKAKAEDV